MSDNDENRPQPRPPLQELPIHYDPQGNAAIWQDGRWVPYRPMPQPARLPIDQITGGPNDPLPPQYQFSLRPAPVPEPPIRDADIDPMLRPPPPPTDPTVTNPLDGAATARARGLKKADKVAGSRSNGKAKHRNAPHGSSKRVRAEARASSDSEDNEPPRKRRGGRPSGSSNYKKPETKKLLDLVGKRLPVGQKGWKEVGREYNQWAKAEGYVERNDKALEGKYKSYLRVKKPTGNAECPPEVKRAHELESQITERVGMRDLSDSDSHPISGWDDSGSDSDVRVVDEVRTAVARRVASPAPRRRAGTELAQNLARAFDPETQRARDDVRAQRSFESTQLLLLHQQLRDAQSTNESLRSDKSRLLERVHEAERARDRAELTSMATRRRSAREDSRHYSREESRRPREGSRGPRSHHRRFHYSSDGPASLEDSDSDFPAPIDILRSTRRRHSPPAPRAVNRRRTPSPGPSRPRPRRCTPSPAIDVDGFDTTVSGNAAELVVTAPNGPSVSLLISPSKGKGKAKEE